MESLFRGFMIGYPVMVGWLAEVGKRRSLMQIVSFASFDGRDQTGLKINLFVHGREVELGANTGQIGIEEIGWNRKSFFNGPVIFFRWR